MKQKQKQNLHTQKNFTWTRTMTCILRISINHNGSRSNALKRSLTQSLIVYSMESAAGWGLEMSLGDGALSSMLETPGTTSRAEKGNKNKTEQSHCRLPAYEAELSCFSEFLFWNNFSWSGLKRFGRSRKRDSSLSGCFLARSPP